ncbi:MAG: hypothetical protein H0T54_07090 [Geodermatophilaceae bacterium]|nr:hypothetical protein [Geodermatophilaceae bacterium]
MHRQERCVVVPAEVKSLEEKVGFARTQRPQVVRAGRPDVGSECTYDVYDPAHHAITNASADQVEPSKL